MKKWIVCLLVLALVLSLGACGFEPLPEDEGPFAGRPTARAEKLHHPENFLDQSVTIAPQVLYEDENLRISAKSLGYAFREWNHEHEMVLTLEVENFTDEGFAPNVSATVNDWEIRSDLYCDGGEPHSKEEGTLCITTASLLKLGIERVDKLSLDFYFGFAGEGYEAQAEVELQNAHPEEITHDGFERMMSDSGEAAQMGREVLRYVDHGGEDMGGFLVLRETTSRGLNGLTM